MSYCRWSSDNFNCDLYCYESQFGYEIHVASNRVAGKIPKVDGKLLMSRSQSDKKRYIQQNNKRSKFFDKCKRKPIGLSSDGESFTLKTLEDFKAKLLELRAEGYNFPNYVLVDVNAEIEAENKSQKI